MPVGETLVKKGLITQDQLLGALAQQKNSSERIDQLLVRLNYVNEREMLRVYGEQLSMKVIEPTEKDVEPDLLKLVPSRIVHKYTLMPIRRSGKAIQVATSDPYNMYAMEELRTCINMPIDSVLATRAEINKLIKNFYGVGGEVLQEMAAEQGDIEIMNEAVVESSDLDVQMAQEASVIKLVNEILIEAIDLRSSDIHFEPFEGDFAVRYRVDGVLRYANVPPEIRRFQNAVISRIKILSGMNIAEKRLPQDGSFKIKVHGREIDLRVSVIPMAFGEGIVLRILDKSKVLISLQELGMEGDTFERFCEVIDRPHGIVLVTGPTGSGKTTSLYAALKQIANSELKILTIEDPVEYFIPGINQTQVNIKSGLSFAKAMRAFLRHDPDVILVGEIRDKETAETAINASLTGHLVFSTLHTNDAVSATTRLIDMGVEPFLISSSLEAVMAQRLVRTLCKHCKEQYEPDNPQLLPRDFDYKVGEKLWRGRGCRECFQTGFSGRRAIFELLTLNDEIREMVVERKSAAALLPAAKAAGMRLLREDGWRLVRNGYSTPEEVVRATKV
ncbi:MAG: GspE/PulE family protein [Phycisphaerae bacterium]